MSSVNNALIVLELLTLLTERSLRLQQLLKTAADEGRNVSDDELNALRADDDRAAADLDAAIERARAAGG